VDAAGSSPAAAAVAAAQKKASARGRKVLKGYDRKSIRAVSGQMMSRICLARKNLVVAYAYAKEKKAVDSGNHYYCFRHR
jgi:hypothetical protein